MEKRINYVARELFLLFSFYSRLDTIHEIKCRPTTFKTFHSSWTLKCSLVTFFPPLSLLTSLFVSRVTISKKYSHSFKAGEKYGARAIRGTNEPRSNLLKTCFSTTVGKRKRWFAVNPLVFFLSLAKLRSKRAQLTRTCVFFINRARDPVKI